MIKNTLKLAVYGFFIGMAIGNTIIILSSLAGDDGALEFTGNLLKIGGSTAGALAIENLFSGIHGAICMAGVELYDLDNWSMTRVVITHYLIIMASFLPIGGLLGWYTVEPLSIAVISALMALGYFIVWVIMYLKYSAEVGTLNEMMKKAEH